MTDTFVFRTGDLIDRCSRANDEIACVSRAAIYEAMPDGAPGTKRRRVSGMQFGLNVSLDQRDLALEHIDHFVL
jgi:hypothetical protein